MTKPQEGKMTQKGELARQRILETLAVVRLQQVVKRVDLERLQRVLVEGGDEDDVRLRVDAFRELEPGEPGHADVEERDVGRLVVDSAQRFEPVGRERQHLELRPQGREPQPQMLGEIRLVVGDDGAYATTVGDGRPRIHRECGW